MAEIPMRYGLATPGRNGGDSTKSNHNGTPAPIKASDSITASDS